MFDVGFWELMVIAVVALLVVGPDRLPALVRTAGLWTGRMRGFVRTVKTDIERELAAEELKKILDKQSQLPGLESLLDEPVSKSAPASSAAQESPAQIPKANHNDSSDHDPR